MDCYFETWNVTFDTFDTLLYKPSGPIGSNSWTACRLVGPTSLYLLCTDENIYYLLTYYLPCWNATIKRKSGTDNELRANPGERGWSKSGHLFFYLGTTNKLERGGSKKPDFVRTSFMDDPFMIQHIIIDHIFLISNPRKNTSTWYYCKLLFMISMTFYAKEKLILSCYFSQFDDFSKKKQALWHISMFWSISCSHKWTIYQC